MDNIYQYEINEDILIAKYISYKEPVRVFEQENLFIAIIHLYF